MTRALLEEFLVRVELHITQADLIIQRQALVVANMDAAGIDSQRARRRLERFQLAQERFLLKRDSVLWRLTCSAACESAKVRATLGRRERQKSTIGTCQA